MQTGNFDNMNAENYPQESVDLIQADKPQKHKVEGHSILIYDNNGKAIGSIPFPKKPVEGSDNYTFRYNMWVALMQKYNIPIK